MVSFRPFRTAALSSAIKIRIMNRGIGVIGVLLNDTGFLRLLTYPYRGPREFVPRPPGAAPFPSYPTDPKRPASLPCTHGFLLLHLVFPFLAPRPIRQG